MSNADRSRRRRIGRLLVSVLILVLLWPTLEVLRYQHALRVSSFMPDRSAAAVALAALEPLYLARPADTMLARRTAAALTVLGRQAEARAVLETTASLVPTSQLIALALLPYREADHDWAGVNAALATLQLRNDLIERQLQRALIQRDWPTVLTWWRRFVQLNAARADDLTPLAAVAAYLSDAPSAPVLEQRARRQGLDLVSQRISPAAAQSLPPGGWLRLTSAQLTIENAADASQEGLPPLGFDRSGIALLHLVDVPDDGTWLLSLAGRSVAAVPLTLRVGLDDQTADSTVLEPGADWRFSVPLQMTAGRTVVSLDVIPDGTEGEIVITTAVLTPQATP